MASCRKPRGGTTRTRPPRSALPDRTIAGAYILRRLILIVPTIIGILAISFLVVQFAPGGPVERVIAQLTGSDVSATARISGGGGDFAGVNANQQPGGDVVSSRYRG